MPTHTRQRRRSYMVTTTNQDGTDRKDQRVIAPSPESAANYFTGRGFKVHGVKVRPRGGTAAERKPTGRFRFSTLAVRQATASLGLKFPVDISLSNVQGGRYGYYVPSSNGLRHTIKIKSWLSPTQASEILWHELCHAMQTERSMNICETNLLPAYSRVRELYAPLPGRQRGRYKYSPAEIEARRMEKRAVEFPLVRS